MITFKKRSLKNLKRKIVIQMNIMNKIKLRMKKMTIKTMALMTKKRNKCQRKNTNKRRIKEINNRQIFQIRSKKVKF